MADNDDGRLLPLHRACRNPGSTLEDIQRLIEEDPQALAMPDADGYTPLHLACCFLNHLPGILQVLLDRSPTEALGMCNHNGYTPLHLTCSHRVSIDIIRRMIRLYPKALRIFNIVGNTPLHFFGLSTEAASLEKLELFVLHCPEVCLLLNNRNYSPHDRVVEYLSHQPDVVALLRAATTNALIAFLVCVHQTLVPVTPTSMTHIRQVLPGLFEEGSSISYMSSNEAIRQALNNHETLKTILRNDELQSLLKEEDCQDLIRGVYRMVQAGRNHTRHEDFKDHMCIIESVTDLPDFMYLHLRSNPTLCVRSTVGGAAQQQVSSTTEQGAKDDATQTELDRTEGARPPRKRKVPDYLCF
jgi:hypothetical protein